MKTSNKPLNFEQYIGKFPENIRASIQLLETFHGNRTKISFAFGCGCKCEKLIKEALSLSNLNYCKNCKPKIKLDQKTSNNSGKFLGKEEGKDFVICTVCGYHAKSLRIHLNKKHNISPENYSGKIICSESSKTYSEQNKYNGNWISRANDAGIDLSDYKEKMSKAVSESILADPDDRKRRSKIMTTVNKSDIMRKKASDTAKKTSARRDIQLQRVARIHAWQKANPEEHYKKCILNMLDSWHSKPENELFNMLKERSKYNFKQNQFLKSNTFITNTKRKQIDIADHGNRMYIEFDGVFHFKQTTLRQLGSLETTQLKDKLLDDFIIDNGFTLIRVSFDQFSYKKSDYGFSKKCIDRIFEILEQQISGVYYIGEAYATSTDK
jgi:hypothetical protein